MEAEREAVSMYRAYLMRDQVGEKFTGTVSAVTSFGAFVEIEEPFVEGLIKLDSLGARPDGGPNVGRRGEGEDWDHDAVHMRLTGRKTGRSIELGDKVTVEINNVSVVRRRIDFTLLAGVAHERRPAVEPAPRAPLHKKKVAAREVERAQRPERGAVPRKSGDGKIRLGVSHRGLARSKPSQKPKKR
jgi:ribonuclease R